MKMKEMKNRWLGVPLVALLFASVFSTVVYAEDAKDVYNQAKLDAELEFSETILKAKAELKAIYEQSSTDPEIKKQSEENYDKIVAEAKSIRDEKIAQAWKTYKQESSADVNDSKQVRDEFTEKIKDTKIEYEKQLEDARIAHEKSLSEATNDQDIKALEEEYEKTLDEIKQTYNNAIATANEEYRKAKESLKKEGDL